MNVNTKVFSLIALQLLLVGGLLGYRSFTVATGDEIVLETAPVDPRDLFRGDYATLRYQISSLTIADAADWDGGDRVYVLLDRDGETYHRAVSVHHERPAVSGEQVCLRGRVNFVNEGGSTATLDVDYGIESYFIPEGAGDPPRDAKIDARVVVDRFCTGVVTAILVDGQPWRPERNGGR